MLNPKNDDAYGLREILHELGSELNNESHATKSRVRFFVPCSLWGYRFTTFPSTGGILRLYQTHFDLRSSLLKLGRLNMFIYARKNATLRRLPDGLTAKWSQ